MTSLNSSLFFLLFMFISFLVLEIAVAQSPFDESTFPGKYQAVNSRNYETFLVHTNVDPSDWTTRREALENSTVEVIKTPANEWQIIRKEGKHEQKLTFKLQEEFEETTFDGRKCKTIVRKAGPQLIQEQFSDKIPNGDSKIVWEFDGNKLSAQISSLPAYEYTISFLKE